MHIHKNSCSDTACQVVDDDILYHGFVGLNLLQSCYLYDIDCRGLDTA